jgi:hypothetical protein
LDEIIVLWPHESFEKIYKPNNNNFDATNVWSEWDFTIKPKLQELAKTHPEIKITLDDWGHNVKNHKIEDGYVENRGHNITPYFDIRHDPFHNDSVKQRTDITDRSAVISGIDKPRICLHEGAYKIYFLDILLSMIGPPDTRTRKEHHNMELFYWSPDSVKILVKQAHSIVNFFELFPAFKNYVKWPTLNPSHRTWYENSIKAIIYPDVNLDFFQVNKLSESVIGWDRCMFNIPGIKDRVLGIANENIEYLNNVIDSKYFNDINGIPAFKGFINGMWTIKKIV